jgi:phage baseplate assembly protein W
MAQKFVGVTLPFRMGNSGMFEQSTNVIQQMRSNFRNLILTKKGERLNEPDLGCDLWKILFQPLTDDTLEEARLAVVAAVDRWLPFIELIDFDISTNDEEKVLKIRCLYRFRNNPNVTDEIIIDFLNDQSSIPRVEYETEGDLFERNSTLREQRANARQIRRP